MKSCSTLFFGGGVRRGILFGPRAFRFEIFCRSIPILGGLPPSLRRFDPETLRIRLRDSLRLRVGLPKVRPSPGQRIARHGLPFACEVPQRRQFLERRGRGAGFFAEPPIHVHDVFVERLLAGR